jgi:hypothetical protein
MKNVGVEKLASVRRWYRTVAIDVCFLKCSRHLFFNIFPFPVSNAQLKGDWHENTVGEAHGNVRSASFLNCPSMGHGCDIFQEKKFLAHNSTFCIL